MRARATRAAAPNLVVVFSFMDSWGVVGVWVRSRSAGDLRKPEEKSKYRANNFSNSITFMISMSYMIFSWEGQLSVAADRSASGRNLDTSSNRFVLFGL